MKGKKYIILVLAALSMIGCDLEREVLVVLPQHEPQLSVEWYIEPGKPFRMTLIESVGYFDAPSLPAISDALVIISYNGISDTLKNQFAAGQNLRVYNYVSETTAPFETGITYQMYVRDAKNREATASSTSLPATTIDTLELLWNSSNTQASLLTSVVDFPGQKNYYRVIVHSGTTSEPSIADSWFDDQISSNDLITIGSQFAFEKGDTAIVTVYHISKEYHDFLRSVRNAQNANLSPFGQPAALQSNINGGIGIFTTIAETRDTLFVK